MIEAGCHRRSFLGDVLGWAKVDEGKAMVLVVISQECQAAIAMLHPRLKYPCVPVDHFVVAVGVENDVSEFAGCNHAGLPGSLGGILRRSYRLEHKY